MTVLISTVNVGSTANDGTGDNIRDAFIKYNNSIGNLKIGVDNLLATSPNTALGKFANITVTNRVLGDLHFYGPDTVYINGSPVATAATTFPGGDVTFQANFNSTNTSSNVSSGALTVVGGVGIGGNLNIGLSANIGGGLLVGATGGNLLVASGDDAGDLTSGAIISLGGLAVTKNARIGQSLVVGGSITTAGLSSSAGVTFSVSTPSTNSSTGALVISNGGLGVAGNVNIGGNASVAADFVVSGNLAVLGGSTYGYQSLSVSDNIVDLHTYANLAPLTYDDGKDIGFAFHYYKPGYGDSHAFLGWANDSGALEYYDRGTEVGNVFTGTTYGTIKPGSITLANARVVGGGLTANTGSMRVWGDGSISGNLFVGGTTTLSGPHITGGYADNFPIGANTAATGAFTTATTSSTFKASGNIVAGSGTSTTSTTTGALVVSGGAGISGNIVVGGSIVPSANTTSNLGDSTHWFNTFFGVSTQAKYADLAENYQADAAYEPGTVVIFGGDNEVTECHEFADTRVAGVVSTEPAHLMNSGLQGENVVAVALRGRVPVKVVGVVTKGDLLVTADRAPGYAVSVGRDNTHGQAVFAKALETNNVETAKVITAVII
jgi:hypothetical protein